MVEAQAIEISTDALLARGYKEFSPSSIVSPYAARLFQRRIVDERGTAYFVGFEYYDGADHGLMPAWQVTLTSDASEDSYVWVKMRVPTIERGEELARALWLAAGGVYYEERCC